MSRERLIPQKRWLRRTVSSLRMKRVDRRRIPIKPNEIRLFMVVRNETLHLPYLYDYYRSRGVDRFFAIENNSSDDTLVYLLEQEDTHVFRTSETFFRKEAWLDLMFRHYGDGHWCLIVDADEYLDYPHSSRAGLRDLCGFLDTQGCNALHCLLLDMYPDRALKETHYQAGDDPLGTAPCFDLDSYGREAFSFRGCSRAPDFRYVNGPRHRVFGVEACCSKIPLFRYHPEMFLLDGQHDMERAAILDDMEGVLLHFKYLTDFADRVLEEAERGEHWDHASQYKEYAKVVRDQPSLDLTYADTRRFETVDGLVDLGLIRASDAWTRAVSQGL